MYSRSIPTTASCLALALLAALPALASAQGPTPVLVKDIRTAPPVGPSSTPQGFVRSGSIVYFTATTNATGRELYYSIAGATGLLLKDIQTGESSSDPQNLTPVGSRLFFTADDGTHGRELWVTDGTATGTTLVLDIQSGTSSSSIAWLTELSGKVYFSADDGTNGAELWVSDGTATGTKMVKDIHTSGSSNPEYLVAYNGKLLFSANDGTNGSEPWISNGTSDGTQMILDLNVGFSSVPQYLTVFGGLVYFSASDGPNGGHGFELWRTDGTAAGTTLFADLKSGTSSGSFPSALTVIGNKLYFAATGDLSGGGSGGTEPWVTDGTSAGTYLLGDLRAGSGSSISVSTAPPQFTGSNGKVFFIANGDAGTSTTGNEVYVTDGTKNSAVLLLDIRSGSSSSSPDYLTDIGTTLLFSANDGSNGQELWLSDGTTAGTKMAFDFNSGSASSSPTGLVDLGNNQALVGLNDGKIGSELWRTGGTTATTTLVADIHKGDPNATLGSTPVFVTDVNGTLYFRAIDDQNGNELWKSDGTTAGTVLVKDINPGGSSTPGTFTPVGDRLFFTANDGSTGVELYVTDGTPAGTVRLGDINPGTGSAGIGEIAVLRGKVYFDATDGTNGNELWVSDGTPAGTKLVLDIRSGSSSSSPTHLMATGDTLYFVANDGTNGIELWKSDGTATGTVMVKDLNAGSSSGLSTSSTRRPVILGNLIYFAATGTNGTELYVSDGTAAGTVEVADINQGSSSSTPSNLTVVGNRIFFSASDGINGTELWLTDGTATGTVLVADLRTGSSSASYSDFVAFGNKLFFRSNYNYNGTTSVGSEPFVSDGTAAGTFMLMDINSGTSSSNPNFPAAVGSRHVYFNATDGTASGNHGAELWRTDGTTAGTVRVTDLNPGTASSSPNYFTLSRGKLYFKADDGVYGDELYVLDVGATGQPLGFGLGKGAVPVLSLTDPVLGGTAQFAVSFAPPSAAGISFFGFPGAVTDLGFGCNIYVDLTKPYIVLYFQSDAGGRFQTGLQVPNKPSLTGLTMTVQAGISEPGLLPLSAAVSNAVVVTAGN